ncbi:1-phosphofructokinase family hexose kinase [Croceicoccus ponticola]|uniref:Phosphofructokinase n=1 Tax=Croceicoccus ponticola TaxID=2217664 RepID=A0A437GZC2_9SPHN|nr:1-phosphofructokinase family hexose kinase [Croceicoccus ponticola]RVQ68701.1 1-phosphofructokinase family hexose kinase [Croceicoccus ponticola]
MEPIFTLTLNPAIDGACEADVVQPTHKIRTANERYDPGGGGINVARVLHRLKAPVIAVYCAGGASGGLLDDLIDRTGVARHCIPIAGQTRMSLAVFERSTGQEYRFVPEGPEFSDTEWQSVLDFVGQAKCGWMVASGSLPRGVPADFYARLAAICTQRKVRLVLDTSGEPLAAAMEAGGLCLVKPSLGEFETLVGRKLETLEAVGDAALTLVKKGNAQQIAVTLGHRGAVLAHAGGVLCRPGLDVPVKSATGAGDSFVAGMVHGLASGMSVPDAFRRGMAAGTAAVLTPGTDLCTPADIDRMWEQLGAQDECRG